MAGKTIASWRYFEIEAIRGGGNDSTTSQTKSFSSPSRGEFTRAHSPSKHTLSSERRLQSQLELRQTRYTKSEITCHV